METIIEPRFSETDALGHINNTVIPIWLEASRNEFFKIFTPDLSVKNWKLVIVNLNINFKHEILFGKQVKICTYIKNVGHTSVQLYEEIWQDGVLCVDSVVTYVNVHMQTMESEEIGNDVRQKLEKYYKVAVEK